LQACKELLAVMPDGNRLVCVIVMHLDPNSPSRMAEIMQAVSRPEVVQANASQLLEAGRVYVIAPGTSLHVVDGSLQVEEITARLRHPVDELFSSLAAAYGERSVGIVLSGTGDDGSTGLRDIEAAGGLCVVQDPATAEHPGMPEAALATVGASLVLAPAEVPDALLRHLEEIELRTPDDAGVGDPGALDGILAVLTEAYGVEFRRDYKRGTLARRAVRRVGLKGAHDLQGYLALLRRDPSEVAALYRDVLIGVTAFFRDPVVWAELESAVFPELLARHDASTPLKIWVPGCATGEEAYSLAMVAIEQIERTEWGKSGSTPPLQVFGTDLSDGALTIARRGSYPESVARSVSPERLERFFRAVPDGFQVRRALREHVVFSRHDLLVDPPFSRVDLLSCRNVLIYLEAQAQHHAMELFHFSLVPGGVLVLGTSETIGRHTELFEAFRRGPQAMSKRARVYRAVGTKAARPQSVARFVGREPFQPPASSPARIRPRLGRIVEQIVLSRYTSACVVVSEAFDIQSFFGPTQEYLVQPTGEARMDLLSWARPGLYPGLRAALERARSGSERVERADLRVDRSGVSVRVSCTIERISLAGEGPQFLVAFSDIAATPADPGAPPSEASTILELEAELRASRAELYDTVEQLESSTEAYRSSHEELLSLNEELQSNNEELEASKEELQSLNEEMTTINRQLEEKNTELQVINGDLDNLLVSTDIAILFLDRDLRVRRYTTAMTELMRLVPSDVGRKIQDVKESYQDDTLATDALRVLEKLVAIEREVETEAGRWFLRRILPYRTHDERIDGVCVAFQDVTGLKAANAALDDARQYAELIVATVRTPLVVLSGELAVVSANDAFCRLLRVAASTVDGARLYDLADGMLDVPDLRTLLETSLPNRSEVVDYEIEHDFARIGRCILTVNARWMSRPRCGDLILLSLEDVTDRRVSERSAVDRADELEREHRWRNEFLAMLGHELRNPLSSLTHGLFLLGRKPPDAGRREEIEATMRRQAARIGAILDQLLDVARLSARKIRMARRVVDLGEVVRTAVEATEPLIAARRHELRVDLPEDGVAVRGDAGRLTQVVENLLSNAAKYTEEGGQVHVQVEADAYLARIRVRDRGVGIDPEVLPHVFELFVQAPRSLHRAEGGLGLGLALVRKVVEMHGGTVTASSAGLGEGAEFVVELPRVERVPASHPPQAAGPAAPSHRLHRVLIVDDELETAAMLSEILAQEGHETRLAPEGSSAIAVARDFQPDVVLLDLGLPGDDGYEVARQLKRELSPASPVVVALTGYGRDDDRLREAGFDQFMIKPPDLERLVSWLAQPDPAGTL
jgi:two-component system, chemotaxis family, CheB/CheR fusion protein